MILSKKVRKDLTNSIKLYKQNEEKIKDKLLSEFEVFINSALAESDNIKALVLGNSICGISFSFENLLFCNSYEALSSFSNNNETLSIEDISDELYEKVMLLEKEIYEITGKEYCCNLNRSYRGTYYFSLEVDY